MVTVTISIKKFLLGAIIGSIATVFFTVVSFVWAQQDSGVTSTHPSPSIVRSIPQSGGRGQYVTLIGTGLGTTPGNVSFVQGGQEVQADTNFVPQCQRIWWRDSSLIIKVPQGVKNGLNKLKIKSADGTSIKDLDFTVTNAVAPPGICGLTPDNGPSGIGVHIYGERFGESKGRVTFGTTDVQVAQDGWRDTEIVIASVPTIQESLTQIRVIRSDNTLTNPGVYSYGACRANQCGVGSSCCSDGSCRPAGTCTQEATQCTYSWSFSTGTLKGLGASCKNNTECFSSQCTGGKCTQGTTALGGACTFDQQCAIGGLCVNKTCQPTLKKIGAHCSDASECQSNICTNTICVPGTKKLGEACSNSDECSTLRCVGGTCVQQPRCLKVEEIQPQGKAIHQNSVFSVRFNQLVDEQSVRQNFNLTPSIQGTYSFETRGEGATTKTIAKFSPSSLLLSQQRYAVVIGKGVKAASSENTLGSCVDVGEPICTSPGEKCTAPHSICTNGARCSGPDSVCSGQGTQCTGVNSICVDGAQCTRGNRSIQKGCFLTGAGYNNQRALATEPSSDHFVGRVLAWITRIVQGVRKSVGHIGVAFLSMLNDAVFATGIADTKPVITNVEKTGDHNAKITWTYTGAAIDRFEIYRIKDTADWPSALTPIGSVDVGANDGTTFSFVDTGPEGKGLSLGTYRYKVRAAGTNEESNTGGDEKGKTCSVGDTCKSGVCDDTGHCTAATIPTAPTGLHTTDVFTNQINLAWNNDAQNVRDFYIERSTNGKTFARLQNVTIDKKTFVYADMGLSAFTRYWYRVRAINDIGPSLYSNIVDATTKDQNFCTDTSPVEVPTAVTATSQTADAITVGWRRGGTNERAFELQRSGGISTTFDKVTGIPVTPDTAYTYRDFNLTANTNYSYRIIASNCKDESSPSTSASATTSKLATNGATCTDSSQCASGDCVNNTCVVSPTGTGGTTQQTQKPAAPSQLTAEAKSSSEVSLDWKVNSANEKTLLVYRSENGTDFTSVATLGPGAISYFDRKLSRFKKYYYKVAAQNDVGVSDFSNTADATTQIVTWCLLVPKPASPSLTQATARSANTIALRWTDTSNNETAFFIQRSQAGSPFVGIASIGDGSQEYADANLTADTQYSYRIVSHNCAGDSDPSTVLSATTSKLAPNGATCTDSSQCASGDCVNNTCVVPPTGGTGGRCGDGIIQLDRGEQCDNGTSAATTTCTSSCTFPSCGPGGTCPTNTKCDSKENECHPVCTTDASCQAPLICDQVDNVCREPVNPVCQAANQCTASDDCKICVPACSAASRCNPPVPVPNCKTQGLLTCQKGDGTLFCAQSCGSQPVVCSASAGCSLTDDCKLCTECAQSARCQVSPKNCKAQGQYECQDSTGKTYCSTDSNCGAGVTPNGGSCTSNVQCASGLCQGGACVGRQPGETCSNATQCASDICKNGVCQDQSSGTKQDLAPGSSCTANAQCASLTCSNGTCQQQGTGDPGTQCTVPTQCKSGSCVGGLCGGSTPPGGTCTSDNQCESRSCVSGTCSKLPDGSECRTASQCTSGECIDARCTSTGTLLASGAACTRSAQCASNQCQDGVCQGLAADASCSSASQCASNACVNGVCQGLPGGAACTHASQCASNACTKGVCEYPDSDHDGLPDNVDPDPHNPDTDGDGLLDGIEDKNHNGRVDEGETDPTDPDTDHDGLLDGQEDKNHNGIKDVDETNPLNPDTDGDGLLDGCDPYPLDPTRPPRVLHDSDGDGISDEDEKKHGTNPYKADTDNDGLLDCQEDKNHNGKVDKGETDPKKADSDGNGIKDGDQCSVLKKAEIPPQTLFAKDAHRLTHWISDLINTLVPRVFADSATKTYSQYSDSSDAFEISGGGGGGSGGGTVTVNAPTNVSVSTVIANFPRLQITWTDTNGGTATYTVESRTTNGTSMANLVFIAQNASSPYNDPATPPPDRNSWPLVEGTSYTYRVCATKSGTISQCSQEVAGTTNFTPPPPDPITELNIYSTSDTSVPLSSDTFLCLRNDCTQDARTDVAGNQHQYRAEIKDVNGVVSPTAGIVLDWSFEGGHSYLDGPSPVFDTNQQARVDVREVSGKSTNSGAVLVVKATQTVNGKTIAVLERRIPINVNACDSAWPSSMQTTNSPYSNNDLDFSMWYCRGSGVPNILLPALGNPIPLSHRQENAHFDYEYIVPIDTNNLGRDAGDKSIRSDVLVMRIARVHGTYSVDRWYRDTFGSAPSPHEPVNGYQAVQDANGVYVLAYDTSITGNNLSNVLYALQEKDTFGQTVYYFTTNTGASPSTKEILNQLLAHIVFSKNIGYDPSSVLSAGMKLRRDMQRMIDMEGLTAAMNTARQLPRLDSGSFIKNQTISAWQTSWNEVGGLLNVSLPDDPLLAALNKDHFTDESQCTTTDYEQSSCWNNKTRHFGSTSGFNDDVENAIKGTNTYAYSYKFIPAPSADQRMAARFCGRLEYLKVNPDPATRYLICPYHQRNGDNTPLKARDSSCTNDNECSSGSCDNSKCAGGLPTGTLSLPPRILSVKHNGTNLAGQELQKNWDSHFYKTITISADDPDGTVTSIESSLGSFAFTGTTFDLDINALQLGDNTLTITVEDDFGTRVSKEIHFTIKERKPNTNPDLSITVPAPDGSTAGVPEYIREQKAENFSFSFTVSDPDTEYPADSVAKVHWELISATGTGQKVDGDLTSSPWVVTASLANLDDGTYTVSAIASDTRGGSTTKKVQPYFTIRTNTPPSFANTQPADNSVYNKGDDVTISGTATDQDSVAWVRLYRVAADGSESQVASTNQAAVGTMSYSFTLNPKLDVGSFIYKIVASDSRNMKKDYLVNVKVVQNGDWSVWGTTCSKSCGTGGIQTRTCTNPTPSTNGGAECVRLPTALEQAGQPTTSSDRTEKRTCDPAPPPCPINGGWSTTWVTTTSDTYSDGAGGTCSKSCGGGEQQKTCDNPTPQYGGNECTRETGTQNAGTQTSSPSDNREVRSCNTQGCPVNGGWSNWLSSKKTANFDDAADTRAPKQDRCSAECGGGLQFRVCDNPAPLYGGAECTRLDGTKTSSSGPFEFNHPCNTGACPYWSAPTACTTTAPSQCGGGSQSQTCVVSSGQVRSQCGPPTLSGATSGSYSNGAVYTTPSGFCSVGSCPTWGLCGGGAYAGFCGTGTQSCAGGSAPNGQCLGTDGSYHGIGASQDCSLGACPASDLQITYYLSPIIDDQNGNTRGYIDYTVGSAAVGAITLYECSIYDASSCYNNVGSSRLFSDRLWFWPATSDSYHYMLTSTNKYGNSAHIYFYPGVEKRDLRRCYTSVGRCSFDTDVNNIDHCATGTTAACYDRTSGGWCIGQNAQWVECKAPQ